MLTQSQGGALSRWFGLLDADGNGVIEAADYDVMARRVCQSFAYGVDTPAYERVQRTYLGLWYLLSDGGATGVDREHFVAWYAEHLVGRPDGYESVLAPVVDAILEMVDANGDGRVDVDEFSRLLEAYGVDSEDAARAFAHVDRDGDGYLDRPELHRAARRLYARTAGAPAERPRHAAPPARAVRPGWILAACLAVAGLAAARRVRRR